MNNMISMSMGTLISKLLKKLTYNPAYFFSLWNSHPNVVFGKTSSISCGEYGPWRTSTLDAVPWHDANSRHCLCTGNKQGAGCILESDNISDFLEDFKSLLPEYSIIPKMHFMIHYPRHIIRWNNWKKLKVVLNQVP